MTRVKRGFKARRRRNRVLKSAKGFRGGRRRALKPKLETNDGPSRGPILFLGFLRSRLEVG